MNNLVALPEIMAVRFYAVTGGKTKNGGMLVGTSSLVAYNNAGVLEGDSVIYPDGEKAYVMQDISTGMVADSRTAAAVGTEISNGDVIVDAGQQSMALFEFVNGKCACMYLDGEEELVQLKARGLI